MKKYTLFRFLIFCFFAVLTAAALFVLDESIYQTKKWDYMKDNQSQYMDLDRSNVVDLAKQVMNLPPGPARELRLGSLRRVFGDRVSDTSTLVRLRLIDNRGVEIATAFDPQKLERRNAFPNSLFLDFEKNSGLPNLTQNSDPTRNGQLIASWTNPLNDPYFVGLTYRYAAISLVIVLIVSGVYLLLDRFFMRPYGAVLGSVDKSIKSPTIIRPPRSRLEVSYNNLAREAAIRGIEQHYQDPRRRFQFTEAYQALGDLPELAVAKLGYSWALALTLRRQSNEEAPAAEVERPARDMNKARWQPVSAAFAGLSQAENGTVFVERQEEAGRELAAALMRQNAAGELLNLCAGAGTSARAIPYLVMEDVVEPRACLATLLPDPAVPSLLTILMAGAPPNTVLQENEWEEQTFELLVHRMEEQLRLLAVQRQDLARERNEANVSLARNLGHDLTNVIATSKLDLMTLRRFSERMLRGSVREAENEAFQETLHSLLNNTRYMQEIVDVYRSFSYLKRPTYETCNVNELVEEIATTFQLSTSTDLHLELELDGGLPPLRLEPRLMKLALFNLLNNSLEALQKLHSEQAASSGSFSDTLDRETFRPRVVVRSDAKRDGVRISVEDNGPGIRSKSGERMPPEELQRIFSLGYSTKASSEGEGMGLNWVRTIVQDFHGGSIRAENVEPKGARFVIDLPLAAQERELEDLEEVPRQAALS